MYENNLHYFNKKTPKLKDNKKSYLINRFNIFPYQTNLRKHQCYFILNLFINV